MLFSRFVWLAAGCLVLVYPEERRVDTDGVAYTREEFISFYGDLEQWSLLDSFRRDVRTPPYNMSLQRAVGSRATVLEVLAARRRADANYRVIDVGGSMFGWSTAVIDALLDKNPPSAPGGGAITFFRVRDASDADEWSAVLAHVAEHGRFDFAISTHFLEDIAAPRVVARMLPRVAKAGFVSTPSKYAELSRGCDTARGAPSAYRGYIHHRWIFTFAAGGWVTYPKIGALEGSRDADAVAARGGGRCGGRAAELSFWWEGELHLAIVNDDFLGPSADAVLGYYAALTRDDDCDVALRKCGPREDQRETACTWSV